MPSPPPLRVLVLCTGNSCRSQMAEGWLRHLGGDAVDVHSAGVEAHGLNPRAVAAMADAGVDISGHASKLVDDVPAVAWNVVVTVCDAARDRCPVLPGRFERVHAPFPDPARATGSDADIARAFADVRDAIGAWAKAFLAGRGVGERTVASGSAPSRRGRPGLDAEAAQA